MCQTISLDAACGNTQAVLRLLPSEDHLTIAAAVATEEIIKATCIWGSTDLLHGTSVPFGVCMHFEL